MVLFLFIRLFTLLCNNIEFARLVLEPLELLLSSDNKKVMIYGDKFSTFRCQKIFPLNYPHRNTQSLAAHAALLILLGLMAAILYLRYYDYNKYEYH